MMHGTVNIKSIVLIFLVLVLFSTFFFAQKFEFAQDLNVSNLILNRFRDGFLNKLVPKIYPSVLFWSAVVSGKVFFFFFTI